MVANKARTPAFRDGSRRHGHDGLRWGAALWGERSVEPSRVAPRERDGTGVAHSPSRDVIPGALSRSGALWRATPAPPADAA
jgi:hypothetical protein